MSVNSFVLLIAFVIMISKYKKSESKLLARCRLNRVQRVKALISSSTLKIPKNSVSSPLVSRVRKCSKEVIQVVIHQEVIRKEPTDFRRRILIFKQFQSRARRSFLGVVSCQVARCSHVNSCVCSRVTDNYTGTIPPLLFPFCFPPVGRALDPFAERPWTRVKARAKEQHQARPGREIPPSDFMPVLMLARVN